MALDICVESYGMVVHALDTGFMSHLSNLGFGSERFQKLRSVSEPACQVKQQADGLPFSQAKALWLVDVCDCSYDQAATEMRLDRATLAATVADGRHRIRSGIEV